MGVAVAGEVALRKVYEVVRAKCVIKSYRLSTVVTRRLHKHGHLDTTIFVNVSKTTGSTCSIEMSSKCPGRCDHSVRDNDQTRTTERRRFRGQHTNIRQEVACVVDRQTRKIASCSERSTKQTCCSLSDIVLSLSNAQVGKASG